MIMPERKAELIERNFCPVHQDVSKMDVRLFHDPMSGQEPVAVCLSCEAERSERVERLTLSIPA